MTMPSTPVTLPPEYTGLKRPQVTRPPQGNFAFFFGFVWLLTSLAFVVVGLVLHETEREKYQRLLDEGQAAQATITQLSYDDSDDSTTYYVDYMYSVKTGDGQKRYSQSQSISEDLYDTLRTGQKIEVVYAASDPSVATLRVTFGPPGLLGPLAFTVMGLIFMGVETVVLVRAFRRRRDWRMLEETGIYAQAIVFDRWENTDSEGDSTYFVAYAFSIFDLSGQRQVITHAEESATLYHAYAIGQFLNVRYLPEKPSVCVAPVSS